MGSVSIKPEFPPLLKPGFHPYGLADLRALCVDGIKSSITRKGIMDRLDEIAGAIQAAGISCELWIDGSFVTEKIDPEDVDMLVCVQSDLYDNDPAVKATIDWASDPDRWNTHACDSYKWVEYSSGHPLFADSEVTRLYWADWFGVSRRGVHKGIAVVALSQVRP